jgi:hypothetical protein
MKVAIIVFFVLSISFSNAQHHAHQSDKKTKTGQQMRLGKKFNSTDDLKVRMQKILDLIKEMKNQKKDLVKVAEYGGRITDIVQDIIKTCELEPEADATIHPALGKILDGASDFKKKKYNRGHQKIHEALLEYEKFFIHEGWNH